MLSFSYYILKVICCSAVLYGYYRLFLRDKIFHQYNRFYLLVSVVVSMVTPLIQINIFNNQIISDTGIKLLSIVTKGNEYLEEIILTEHKNNLSSAQFFLIFYMLICLVFAVYFINILLRIRSILKRHCCSSIDNVLLVITFEKGTPFSFLNYIFWNNNIDINSTTGNQIYQHELAHVQQKHSLDKLFINAVLIFFWCNPIFWLIQKELAMIHEFMADKIAVENNDTRSFAAMILKSTYPHYQLPFTNSFFYSPIKRRLIMLSKNTNFKVGYISRILVLPLAVLLFAAFTVKTKTFSKGSTGDNGKTLTDEVINKYGFKTKDAKVDIKTFHKETVRVKNEYEQIGLVTDTIPDDKVFTQVENEASFPGGSIGWKNYLTKNLDPTAPIKEGMKEGTYKVIISFIVKKDGSLSNVTTENYKETLMAKECIALISKGPKWLPATQNGHNVTAYRKQPITFLVQAQ